MGPIRYGSHSMRSLPFLGVPCPWGVPGITLDITRIFTCLSRESEEKPSFTTITGKGNKPRVAPRHLVSNSLSHSLESWLQKTNALKQTSNDIGNLCWISSLSMWNHLKTIELNTVGIFCSNRSFWMVIPHFHSLHFIFVPVLSWHPPHHKLDDNNSHTHSHSPPPKTYQHKPCISIHLYIYIILLMEEILPHQGWWLSHYL